MNDFENPVYSVLSEVADFAIISLLCALCCLPVFTIGASFAAAHRVLQERVLGEPHSLFRGFFEAFRENFAQATAVFLAFIVLVAGALCQMWLVMNVFSGAVATVLLVLIGMEGLFILALEVAVRSLLVRYRNTLREHLHNGLLVLTTRPARCALAGVLTLTPVLLWLLVPDFFYRSMILWPLVGIGGILFLQNLLMKPVLMDLDAQTVEEPV